MKTYNPFCEEMLAELQAALGAENVWTAADKLVAGEKVLHSMEIPAIPMRGNFFSCWHEVKPSNRQAKKATYV